VGEGMSRYRRDEAYMAYAVAVVCTLVLVAAWAIVMPYVPNGWWLRGPS